MEAGICLRRLVSIATAVVLLLFVAQADAANRRTRNFIVDAPSEQLADDVAKAAEQFRHDLAVYWLGKPLDPWPTPCPIRVVAGPNLAAQGVTTYNPRPVRDFQMEVIGTPQRILDSVLPHEVTHTILATHFGRPLPRWADEGICTTVEHSSERNKHEVKLREFLRSRRGIAMNQLFLLTEYPNDVLPMYAQGYSVCRFLIDQQGPREFIAFLHDYMQNPSWTANVRKHYGYDSLRELQEYWLAWVADGSGAVGKFAKTGPQATGPQATGPQTTGPQATPAASVAALPAAESIPLSTDAQQARSPQNPARLEPITAPSGPNRKGPGMQNRSRSPDAPTRLLATGRDRDFARGAATASIASRGVSASANGSTGWYLRRKELAQSGSLREATPGASAIRPIAPPSVQQSRPYSSAHPQPSRPVASGRVSPDVSGNFSAGNWK